MSRVQACCLGAEDAFEQMVLEQHGGEWSGSLLWVGQLTDGGDDRGGGVTKGKLVVNMTGICLVCMERECGPGTSRWVQTEALGLKKVHMLIAEHKNNSELGVHWDLCWQVTETQFKLI